MGLLIFLGCVAVIILWWAIAKEFERIAQKKGHCETRYFWWSFLCGPIGYLMVIALPNQGENVKSLGDRVDDFGKCDRDMKTEVTVGEKTGSGVNISENRATSKIYSSSVVPPQGGTNKSVKITQEVGDVIWCPVCGKVQNKNRTVCFNCEAKFVRDSEL